MVGPFDDIFGKTPFDLDHDGHIDVGEWSLINDTLFSDASNDINFDEDDQFEDELEMAGLSIDELEMMDPDERRDMLEEAIVAIALWIAG